VLPTPICFVTLRKLRFNRLKLSFAVKVGADFRFEIGIAERCSAVLLLQFCYKPYSATSQNLLYKNRKTA
jgi:hypothetical protein